MQADAITVHWQLVGRTVVQRVPAGQLPSVGDHVTFTDRDPGEGTYRVLARNFCEGASFKVIITLEPAHVPVPPEDAGLWEAFEPIARSASNVLGDDGFWCASDRIKDWFDYDDLERVLRVARQHGWAPEDD
jgi:hypothetical protein